MKNTIKYIIIVVIILVLWEYFGSQFSGVRVYVSAPSLVYEYFIANYQSLLHATFITFIEAFLGLILAIIFSFLVMFIGFYRKGFIDFILPAMIASQIVPIIVLAPFFIILFGLGISSKVAMAAVISFFPIFVNFAQGYKAIPIHIHELMNIYKAPISYRIEKVFIPLSLPSIMAGIKISSTLAVIGAIVAEFTGSRIGLGRNLFISSMRLNVDMMMTSLILATCMGFIMYGSVYLIEKKFGKWYD